MLKSVMNTHSAPLQEDIRRPDSASAVFEARGITKVYRMGEVEVHALRGVDLSATYGR
jgi:hypothetical protein